MHDITKKILLTIKHETIRWLFGIIPTSLGNLIEVKDKMLIKALSKYVRAKVVDASIYMREDHEFFLVLFDDEDLKYYIEYQDGGITGDPEIVED